MIFIVGNSRSGTTMLGRVFGKHSSVHTFGELHFFEQQVDDDNLTNENYLSSEKSYKLLERLITSSRDGLFSSVVEGKYRKEIEKFQSENSFSSAADLYEKFLTRETSLNSKSISCEQTPRYLYSATNIMSVYPQAKLICLVRDPRDVLVSQKYRWKRRANGAKDMPWIWVIRSWVNYHCVTTSRIWSTSAQKALSLRNNSSFKIVRYEDLVHSPESCIRELCEFVGVKYESEMLEVERVGSSTGVDIPKQYGIDARNVGRWKKGILSNTELYVCEKLTQKMRDEFGYISAGNKSMPLRALLLLPSFVLKTVLAILLNFNRFGSLKNYLVKRIS